MYNFIREIEIDNNFVKLIETKTPSSLFEVCHNDGISKFETRNIEEAQHHFNVKARKLIRTMAKNGELLGRASKFERFSASGSITASHYLESFGFKVVATDEEKAVTKCGIQLHVDGWLCK